MAKSKAGQGKKKSFRLRFNFWLNMEKPEEVKIADQVEVLKNKRHFSSVIRNGIRLMCDLRDGKLDVLFELFPWVKAEFLEYMREVKTTNPTENETAKPASTITSVLQNEREWIEAEQERMEQERAWEQRRLAEAQKALEAERRAIEQERQRMEAERSESQNAIQEQLDRMEQLMLFQGYQRIDNPTEASRGEPPQNHSGGPKQLSVQKFSAPAYDDDDEEDLLEVKKDESAGMRATQNFLKSLMGLNEEPSKPPQNSYSGDTKSRRKRSQEMQQ